MSGYIYGSLCLVEGKGNTNGNVKGNSPEGPSKITNKKGAAKGNCKETQKGAKRRKQRKDKGEHKTQLREQLRVLPDSHSVSQQTAIRTCLCQLLVLKYEGYNQNNIRIH